MELHLPCSQLPVGLKDLTAKVSPSREGPAAAMGYWGASTEILLYSLWMRFSRQMRIVKSFCSLKGRKEL
jgi:hypothetical protein